MELMQLEMLVAVAEEHSFLRAAERVFRTQPAVSIAIRKLEGKIGVPLLDRSSRRTGRLTPAGERLYEYARRILALRDEALSAVKEQDNPCDGTLRVGLVGDETLNRFPILWKWFKERHPSIDVKLSSDSLQAVLGELANGRLDLGLISGRARCGASGKVLVATRFRQLPCQAWLWLVRPKSGKSALAHTFETTLLENVSVRGAMSKPRAGIVRRLRVVR